MPLQSPAQKPFGRGEVSPLAEPELNSIAIAVDDTIYVALLAPNFHVGFVNVPSASDGPLALVEALQQFG